MAAKASGTWLKVASKGGGAKSVFVSNKLGGRAFNEGETITQSELNAHLATASKALEKQGIDAKARFPGTYKQATAKAGSSSSGADMAKLASENIQSSQRQKQAIADNSPSKVAFGKAKQEALRSGNFEEFKRLGQLERADRKRRKQENPDAPEFARAAKAAATKQAKQASQQKTASSSTRQQRIAEIKANINAVANDKTKTPAERYPAWRKENFIERNAQANENANLIFGRGKGNRAKRRANAIKGNNK